MFGVHKLPDWEIATIILEKTANRFSHRGLLRLLKGEIAASRCSSQ